MWDVIKRKGIVGTVKAILILVLIGIGEVARRANVVLSGRIGRLYNRMIDRLLENQKTTF